LEDFSLTNLLTVSIY